MVASNDGTALGALEAMKTAGLGGKIPISGQDATEAGFLEKGELAGEILLVHRAAEPPPARPRTRFPSHRWPRQRIGGRIGADQTGRCQGQQNQEREQAGRSKGRWHGEMLNGSRVWRQAALRLSVSMGRPARSQPQGHTVGFKVAFGNAARLPADHAFALAFDVSSHCHAGQCCRM